MVNRAPLIASLALVAGMAAVSAAVWTQIPDAARLPIHWDINGVPNGYAPKAVALLVAPVLALLLTLLLAGLASIRSTASRDALDSAAWRVGWIGSVLLLAIAHAIVILTARGVRLDVAGNVTFAAALLLIALGNFLGKVRANPWLGIRTPWTRTSTYSWEKTNRRGGRLLVAVGLATLGTIAVFGVVPAVYVLMAGSAATALVTSVASYRYWKRDPDRAIS
ncbi:MAG TPA: DUF1648 domain-containing protein [Rhizomicrobium sp.]